MRGTRCVKVAIAVALGMLILIFSSCDGEDVPRERPHEGLLSVLFAEPDLSGTVLDRAPFNDGSMDFTYTVQLYTSDGSFLPGKPYSGDDLQLSCPEVPSGTWTLRFILCDSEIRSLAYYTYDCNVTIEDQKVTFIEIPTDQNGLYLFQDLNYYLERGLISVRYFAKESFDETTVPMQNGLFNGWGTVTGFADHAFDGCTLLTQIPSIDCSIQSIGKYAFANCTSLESYVIPEGVERIEESTFENCTSLRSVTIPSSVKYIGKNAFKNCTSLEEVVIPEDVCYIDYNCFEGCTSLSSVQLPSTIKLLKPFAFNNCESLQSLELPEGLLEIEEYALNGCGLLELNIPDTVVAIRRGGLANCPNLVKVTYGATSNLKVISTASFLGDLSLTTLGPVDGVVKWPVGMYEIPAGTFDGCSSITDVFIPEGVECIYDSNFRDCSSLVSIHLPDSLTFISSSVFKGCSSLASIYIPQNVDYMGRLCFEDCSSLMRIDCGASYWSDSWADFWFGNLPAGATINMGVSR